MCGNRCLATILRKRNNQNIHEKKNKTAINGRREDWILYYYYYYGIMIHYLLNTSSNMIKPSAGVYGEQDQRDDLLYRFEELSCSSSSEAVHMMHGYSINMGSCTLNRLLLYFICDSVAASLQPVITSYMQFKNVL